MTDKVLVNISIEGLDGLVGDLEEACGHIDAAIRLLAGLQGTRELEVKPVIRPEGRTSSRSGDIGSRGGAS